MAIKSVKAIIAGITTDLTLDNATGLYTGTLTAPAKTSYTETGGYYPVTIQATNTAGTVVTDTSQHLVVKETVKPVIIISSPSSGNYVTNNAQPVIFTVTDEVNGSGVNADSLVVTLDAVQVDASQITSEMITNGYRFTYVPDPVFTDGSHTVVINIADNDGNIAETKSTTFIVDTVAPVLTVTEPVDNLETNKGTVVISGTTNDVTSSPVTLTINGDIIEVLESGAWSTTMTLTEGKNVFEIKAVDSAGKSTTVTRTVIYDTTAPVLSNITITPNPVTAGATMVISLEVK